LSDGTELAALIGRAKIGYIRWEEETISEQGWTYIADGPDALKSLREALGDNNPDEWQETRKNGLPKDPFGLSIMLPMMNPKNGQLFTFGSSSLGGVKAARRLIQACVALAKSSAATTANHVPVVALGGYSYLHPDRQVGEIFNPQFEVTDWVPTGKLMHLIAKSGHAAALGFSSQEAINEDLGEEPSEKKQPAQTKPAAKPAPKQARRR
jgi:hypothetical protein